MKTTLIFENGWYTAHKIEGGHYGTSLIVQNKRTGKGSQLVGDNAPHWIKHIETAIDAKEAGFICRAIL